MKKLGVLLIILLTGCTTSTQAECKITYEEPQKIERSILMDYQENTIKTVESVDRIYYDDIFTKDRLELLEEELEEKLKDAKHLKYELVKESNEYVEIISKLSDVEQAHANELSFVGVEISDKDMPLGLKETLKLNEDAGYTCTTNQE